MIVSIMNPPYKLAPIGLKVYVTLPILAIVKLKPMKKFLLVLLISFLCSNLFSQIDYMEVRDQFTVSCGNIDSTELVRNRNLLDSISQFEIINGEEQFLYDLGMTYYKVYLKWKNKEDNLKSAEANQKCWDKYQNTKALWNLGTNYGISQNCNKELELTELYVKHMKEKDLEEFISYKQVYYRYKFCRDN